jgi:GT2 family glycosyltransferase
MAFPRVSVVMPAYNHERFVGPAVESVLDQSMGDLELIVIDDGSTDGTGAAVQGFADPRLTYLRQANQDAYNALNRGLGLARGRFAAILNSDDLWEPTRLERLMAAQAASGAECLFSDVRPIDAEGRPLDDPLFGWNMWHQRNRAFYFAAKDLYTGFLKGNLMVTTSNLLLSTALARRVGGFRPLRYLHDYDYIFRVMLAAPGKVHYLSQDKLLHYRIHGGNTLGEGAIVGRQQDQEVIRQYTLARLPAALQERFTRHLDRITSVEADLWRRGYRGGNPLLRRLDGALRRRLADRHHRPHLGWIRSALPPDLAPLAIAGTERLIDLERELFEVRRMAGSVAPCRTGQSS